MERLDLEEQLIEADMLTEQSGMRRRGVVSAAHSTGRSHILPYTPSLRVGGGHNEQPSTRLHPTLPGSDTTAPHAMVEASRSAVDISDTDSFIGQYPRRRNSTSPDQQPAGDTEQIIVAPSASLPPPLPWVLPVPPDTNPIPPAPVNDGAYTSNAAQGTTAPAPGPKTKKINPAMDGWNVQDESAEEALICPVCTVDTINSVSVLYQPARADKEKFSLKQTAPVTIAIGPAEATCHLWAGDQIREPLTRSIFCRDTFALGFSICHSQV